MKADSSALTSSTIQPALKLMDVAVAFGEPPIRVLDGISLTLQPGEFVALVGPSGCGKSTILRLMGGLLQPTDGNVEVHNDGVPTQANHGTHTSFVFQQPNLLPWRDVIGNVSLPRELARLDPTLIHQEATEACQLVGLDTLDQKKLPKMLSGGMQMRVSLARALITHPTLMLMDEPFAAIDDILRHQLNEDVLRLWQEQKWTCVFVTHQLHDAVFLAQRIVVLAGKPARIRQEFEVPFAYPRQRELRTSVEFAKIVQSLDSSLRDAY